jgi:hypothetical protein
MFDFLPNIFAIWPQSSDYISFLSIFILTESCCFLKLSHTVQVAKFITDAYFRSQITFIVMKVKTLMLLTSNKEIFIILPIFKINYEFFI